MAQARTSFSELSVGQIAERSGTAISALHFYESKGLIKSTRTQGNQRRYSRDTLRRIAFIRASQRVGIPLADIAAALDSLPQRRTPNHEDWEKLATRWQARLDEAMDQLVRLRDDLAKCIGCGCLSLTSCPIANPWDEMGREGPGARRFIAGSPRAPERVVKQ